MRGVPTDITQTWVYWIKDISHYKIWSITPNLLPKAMTIHAPPNCAFKIRENLSIFYMKRWAWEVMAAHFPTTLPRSAHTQALGGPLKSPVHHKNPLSDTQPLSFLQFLLHRVHQGHSPFKLAPAQKGEGVIWLHKTCLLPCSHAMQRKQTCQPSVRKSTSAPFRDEESKGANRDTISWCTVTKHMSKCVHQATYKDMWTHLVMIMNCTVNMWVYAMPVMNIWIYVYTVW